MKCPSENPKRKPIQHHDANIRVQSTNINIYYDVRRTPIFFAYKSTGTGYLLPRCPLFTCASSPQPSSTRRLKTRKAWQAI